MSIREFYANQILFLTGVTGFLGKLLLEKLLRSCPDIKKIYVLVRSKNCKSVDQRLKENFGSKCFHTLRQLNPNFSEKVSVLSGDCTESMLGLSPEGLEILKNEVTCVIHSAASTRFNLDVKTAVFNNARSVRELLILAKEMKHLEAFVYISTAFSFCYNEHIEEKIYEERDPDEILVALDGLDNQQVNKLAENFLGKWPNSYVFSKAVAESFVKKYAKNLPVVIVRPAVVVSTMKEPLEGWMDNFHGMMGLCAGISLGVLKTLQLNVDNPAFIVPADYVVNLTIAAAWHIASSEKSNTKNESILVMNYAPDQSNAITWDKLIKTCLSFRLVIPPSKCIRYPTLVTSTSKKIHQIRAFFYHTLLAYVVDLILFLIGRQPIAVEKYKKIDKLLDVVTFFSINSWTFENKNVGALWNKMDDDDKQKFNFNMRNLNWENFLYIMFSGGRVHLLQDPLITIPAAKRRMYLLIVVHYITLGLIYCFWIFIFVKIYKLLV